MDMADIGGCCVIAVLGVWGRGGVGACVLGLLGVKAFAFGLKINSLALGFNVEFFRVFETFSISVSTLSLSVISGLGSSFVSSVNLKSELNFFNSVVISSRALGLEFFLSILLGI